MTRLGTFTARDGVELGEVILPAIGDPDWTGKRPYLTPDDQVVYLFDDEVDSDPWGTGGEPPWS